MRITDIIIIICTIIIIITLLSIILEKYIAYKWAKLEALKDKYKEKYFNK